MSKASRPKSVAAGEAPRESAPELTGTLRFMSTLWRLDHALNSRSKLMAKTTGITGPQRLVLRLVGRRPGVAAGTVAKTLHLDKSTVTGVLQRLEDRGLLLRRSDPSDGRRTQLRLTPAGAQINADPAGTVEAAVRRVLRRVPQSQRRAAEALLHELSLELLDERGQGASRE